MSIGSKLLTIDRRIIYFILIVVSLVPLLLPLGLPIPISAATQNYYEALKEIPEGSVVVLDWEIRFGRPTWSILLTDTTRYLSTRNMKIIHLSFDRSLEGGEVCEMELTKVNYPRTYGKVYGVDFVNLGANAGGAAAIASFVSDCWKTFPSDIHGTPLANLPIMQYLKTGADIDVVIGIGSAFPVSWIGQLKEKYGTTLIATADTGESKVVQPFVQSGQIRALLTDMQGAAELEILIKQPGEGIKTMDPLNTILLTEAAFLIITNVVFLVTKDVKKSKTPGWGEERARPEEKV